MTPETNRRASAAAKATVALHLMRLSARLVSRVLPPPGSPLRAQALKAIESDLSSLRSEVGSLTFPEMAPVESDLWAQEVLEAFDDLSVEFVKILDGGDK